MQPGEDGVTAEPHSSACESEGHFPAYQRFPSSLTCTLLHIFPTICRWYPSLSKAFKEVRTKVPLLASTRAESSKKPFLLCQQFAEYQQCNQPKARNDNVPNSCLFHPYFSPSEVPEHSLLSCSLNLHLIIIPSWGFTICSFLSVICLDLQNLIISTSTSNWGKWHNTADTQAFVIRSFHRHLMSWLGLPSASSPFPVPFRQLFLRESFSLHKHLQRVKLRRVTVQIWVLEHGRKAIPRSSKDCSAAECLWPCSRRPVFFLLTLCLPPFLPPSLLP